MTAIHSFMCDKCKKTRPGVFDHQMQLWMPPKGWKELWEPGRSQTTGEHLCEECTAGRKKCKKK